MTSSSTTRFCSRALYAGLIILLLSCQQELIIQKDPGSLTAGDYKISGITSYTIAGEVSSVPISGTLSVFAGNQPNAYYFLEKIKGYNQLGYQVTEVGSKFTVEPVYDATKYYNTWYYGKQDGGGTISPSRIELDRYANTNSISITTPTGEFIKYTMPIRKRVCLVATK